MNLNKKNCKWKTSALLSCISKKSLSFLRHKVISTVYIHKNKTLYLWPGIDKTVMVKTRGYFVALPRIHGWTIFQNSRFFWTQDLILLLHTIYLCQQIKNKQKDGWTVKSSKGLQSVQAFIELIKYFTFHFVAVVLVNEWLRFRK